MLRLNSPHKIIFRLNYHPPSSPGIKRRDKGLEFWFKNIKCTTRASIEIIRGESILITLSDFFVCECRVFKFGTNTFPAIHRIEQKFWLIDVFSCLRLWDVCNWNLHFGIAIQGIYLAKVNHGH